MSIEQALAENTAAVNRNSELLEKLLAGREAALEQLTTVAEAAGKAPRTRKKKDEEPAAPAGNAAGDAAAGSGSEQAASQSSAQTATGTTSQQASTEVSDDDLRNAAQTYIAGAGDDKAKRQARGAQLKGIMTHFGTDTLVGETGINDPEQRKQALFYLKRLTAGHEVNFSQDYDFDGDPAQDAAAASADEDFNIG